MGRPRPTFARGLPNLAQSRPKLVDIAASSVHIAPKLVDLGHTRPEFDQIWPDFHRHWHECHRLGQRAGPCTDSRLTPEAYLYPPPTHGAIKAPLKSTHPATQNPDQRPRIGHRIRNDFDQCGPQASFSAVELGCKAADVTDDQGLTPSPPTPHTRHTQRTSQGHDLLCGHVDPQNCKEGLCVNGCGRPVREGTHSGGKKFVTCCRGCALGSHDASCGQRLGSAGGPAPGRSTDSPGRALMSGPVSVWRGAGPKTSQDLRRPGSRRRGGGAWGGNRSAGGGARFAGFPAEKRLELSLSLGLANVL